jgi:hypothetical protein
MIGESTMNNIRIDKETDGRKTWAVVAYLQRAGLQIKCRCQGDAWAGVQ